MMVVSSENWLSSETGEQGVQDWTKHACFGSGAKHHSGVNYITEPHPVGHVCQEGWQPAATIAKSTYYK